jgi:hypothetical protein
MRREHAEDGFRLIQSCSLIAFCNRTFDFSTPHANSKLFPAFLTIQHFSSPIIPAQSRWHDAGIARKKWTGRPEAKPENSSMFLWQNNL